jgi:hypothetical protein
MISANISNTIRKQVYRRDGWQCALCDSTKQLQIHHCIKRSQGGTSNPENLIALCSKCHAAAHGIILDEAYAGVTTQEMQQNITEYLADTYAPDWNPWHKLP